MYPNQVDTMILLAYLLYFVLLKAARGRSTAAPRNFALRTWRYTGVHVDPVFKIVFVVAFALVV